MFTIRGKFGSAKVFSENGDENAIAQIIELLNQPFAENANVRVMPDYHAGAGCVIGTTMEIVDSIVPNLVGVDIGCGMFVVPLGTIGLGENFFIKLDTVIRENIPSGRNVRSSASYQAKDFQENLYALKCAKHVSIQRAMLSVGTLGGGNHFIELAVGSHDEVYLIIHTGSRNLGKQVAEYYQTVAIRETKAARQQEIEDIVGDMKRRHMEYNIQRTLDDVPALPPEALMTLAGNSMEDYLHDMNICQTFASLNRAAIADEIIHGMEFEPESDGAFETVHNYIDMETRILRKGAVSAEFDETLIIPMNMRDGSLLCRGRGNRDWNYSAPHGAGRLFSRGDAKRTLSVETFKEEMEGIYTTCVGNATLDESPMAYKPMREIWEQIVDTVIVDDVLKPVYNFKSPE